MTKQVLKNHKYFLREEFYQSNVFVLIYVQILLATLGSLYFSEIAKFPPCVLCWYQRVAMYPNLVILGVGYYFKDKIAPLMTYILTLIGTAIAFYHVLLYYKILPNAIAPCSAGVSCTTKYIEWAGFITIPLLSLIAHLVVVLLLLFAWKKYRN